MSQTLTIDDIWKLFQETSRLFQESKVEWERRSLEARQEHERRVQQIEQDAARRWEEEERRRVEEERRREEESHRREEESRRREEESRRWEEESRRREEGGLRRKEEADKRMQETERVVKEVSRQIGSLGSRWVEFVEELVAPACETLFAQRGIPVQKVTGQVNAKLPGNRHMEIDIMVINTDVVVLVEVKSKLRQEDVNDHLVRLAQFKDFFWEYANKRIMGGVAAIVAEENVIRYAMNEGLFVIVQSGEAVHLANDEDFVPKAW